MVKEGVNLYAFLFSKMQNSLDISFKKAFLPFVQKLLRERFKKDGRCFWPMEKIILDTSVLLAVSQLKIDLFTEIERVCDFPYTLYVLDGSFDELERLINTSSLSHKKAALFAQKIAQSRNIQVLPTRDPQPVDDILADKTDCIVATVDGALKRRIKARGGRVLTIRQKKYMVFA